MPAKTKPTRQDLGSRHGAIQVESKPSSLLAEYKALRYDYRLVASGHRQTVQDAAVDIRRKQTRITGDWFAIGRRLLEVKDFLPHGEFGKWIDQEFELAERVAQGMMNAARVYLDEKRVQRVAPLSDRAIFMLAAPSTPEEARLEVERIMEASGKVLTIAEVHQVISEAKARNCALLEAPAAPSPPSPRMIEMNSETPALPKPRQISAARPDDPALQKAGFVIDHTDQGYRFYWPARDERRQSSGPMRSTQGYAEEDALTALAEYEAATAEPAPEPTAIDAEYAVAPSATVHPVLSRALALKLQDAVLHRIFKTLLTPAESDELLLALSRALKGEA